MPAKDWLSLQGLPDKSLPIQHCIEKLKLSEHNQRVAILWLRATRQRVIARRPNSAIMRRLGLETWRETNVSKPGGYQRHHGDLRERRHVIPVLMNQYHPGLQEVAAFDAAQEIDEQSADDNGCNDGRHGAGRFQRLTNPPYYPGHNRVYTNANAGKRVSMPT